MLKFQCNANLFALGSKPLSIFGIAHKFQAKKMRNECLHKYPQILEENRAPEQRGLLALLREHLIDLDFMNDENDNPRSMEGVDNEVDVNGAHIMVPHAPV